MAWGEAMSRGGFSRDSDEDDRDEGGFTLPPALARLPDGRGRLPREFVEQNQRDRILFGALEVFGAKGFAAASVQDLIDEASTSRATFYKYFADKEEALRAVHDEVLGWLEEEARNAALAAEDWTGGVLAVSARVLGLFIADPRIARLCGVEAMLGGAEVLARQDEALAQLEAALRSGRSARPWGEDLPALLEPLLLAGAVSMVARAIGLRQDPDADHLIRDLAELILLPYLGADEASRAVWGVD
jgi:AcrR family transcriptional regulator